MEEIRGSDGAREASAFGKGSDPEQLCAAAEAGYACCPLPVSSATQREPTQGGSGSPLVSVIHTEIPLTQPGRTPPSSSS